MQELGSLGTRNQNSAQIRLQRSRQDVGGVCNQQGGLLIKCLNESLSFLELPWTSTMSLQTEIQIGDLADGNLLDWKCHQECFQLLVMAVSSYHQIPSFCV